MRTFHRIMRADPFHLSVVFNSVFTVPGVVFGMLGYRTCHVVMLAVAIFAFVVWVAYQGVWLICGLVRDARGGD